MVGLVACDPHSFSVVVVYMVLQHIECVTISATEITETISASTDQWLLSP